MKNLKDYKKIHFIGIGGVSMTVLAEFLYDCGFEVSGSDAVFGSGMAKLKEKGITVYQGSDEKMIYDRELIIYNAAISESDIELKKAKELNKDLITRKELLSEVSKMCSTVVAVSGTHGKTTATAMIGNIFKNSDKRFFLHVGGKALNFNGGYYNSGLDYFITEACEYKRSFLSLKPDIAVVLNIEQDHPDCYKNFADVFDAFNKFTLSAEKCAVVSGNHHLLETTCDKITFGKDGIFKAYNIINDNEKYSFDVFKNESFYLNVKLRIFGKHNINNALASVAVCDYLNIDKLCIKEGLETFCGIERRYEYKGTLNEAEVITDYAHHPSEIAAVIETALKQTKGRLFVAFEPHTYSRTKRLFNEFLNCFKGAYEVELFPTYAARELPNCGYNGKYLFDKLNNKQKCNYFKNYFACAEYLNKNVRKDDCVLVLGAGTIDEFAKMISE